MKKNIWIWRRQISTAQTDLWLERLAWLDLQRVMIISKPGKLRSRIEVYGSDRAEGRRLLKEHGGSVGKLLKRDLLPAAAHEPIRVNRLLYVVGDKKIARELKQKIPAARSLIIPASMAFGSGEHATTGMVLRQLGRMPRVMQSANVLDLGTGSGILALAARALGAGTITAMDNCADCIRIARDNEQANFSQRKIHWKRSELDGFFAPKKFSAVTANLFSELLISQSARIWQFLAPGGVLLLSGILKTQGDGVIRAFRKLGAKLISSRRRGKWMLLVFSNGK